jgi:hypothetical protein
VFFEVRQHPRDAVGGRLSVDQAQLEKLAGELLDLLFAGGHRSAGE